MLWGNFSADTSLSQLSYLSIVKLLIFLKKSLGPTLEEYIEEPLDLRLTRAIYDRVKPFLDSLTSAESRALFDYRWNGDQDVNDVTQLQVNDPNDFQQGRYKVNLFIKAIAPLQEVTVNIILTDAGVSFE